MTHVRAAGFPLALLLTLAAGCGSGSTGTASHSRFEMYLADENPTTLQITFLKGRTCGRLNLNAQGAEARGALVAIAEQVAGPIPADGSKPTDDAELAAWIPRAGSGALAGWEEDTRFRAAGTTVITTSAGDWANGSVGPFDENGFEAVALEDYALAARGYELLLELVYVSSVAGADRAFHYRSPAAPDEPYWDRGTRLH